MLAKVTGAKRKRGEEEEGDSDVEMMSDDGESAEGEDWMDEDGEGASPKRAKTNSGAVVAKGRKPRGDRSLAGFRDEAVCSLSLPSQILSLTTFSSPNSASRQSREDAECQAATEKRSRQSRRRRQDYQNQNGSHSSILSLASSVDVLSVYSPSTCLLASEKEERPREDDCTVPSFYSVFCSSSCSLLFSSRRRPSHSSTSCHVPPVFSTSTLTEACIGAPFHLLVMSDESLSAITPWS